MTPPPHQPEGQNWQQWPHQTWPAVSAPFVMEQSYSMAPMMTMPAPQHPIHNGFVYDSYAPEATNSVAPPSNQYLAERPLLDMGSLRFHGLPEHLEGTNHLPAKQPSRSPVIKSEPQPSDNAKDSKVTTANTAEGQAQEPVFSTSIDQLLKVIQEKSDRPEVDIPATRPSKTRAGNGSARVAGCRRKRKADNASEAELKDKPYVCRWKKCRRRFPQITHLNIHERRHTGERPHVRTLPRLLRQTATNTWAKQCTFASCGKFFTQKGNLATHERRHLGIRPFRCRYDGCNKAFPQKGNLKAHEKTHDTNREPVICILKSCGKSFSSRGNLKTHQNAYHKEELRELELKFSKMESVTEISEADRELWDYFRTIHKNSNKGIKGRGKECRVELLTHSLSNQCSLQSPPPEIQHAAYPMSHGLPHSMGFSHFNGMQRNNLGQDFTVARGAHGYDVYDMDQASISSGTMTPASSPGGVYDDYHRGLPFHERMY
ncbi:hypothetical protein HD806DRAFT_461199 [Xylariaceae sp. AK1471]|nr:hypothetical protein HD806DRAFT_461199 [Xylariaceae sp. AK1471]